MQEITYTQTSYIRSCQQKYKFRYVDCLAPKVIDKALLRGTVIHESFEKYFKGVGMDDILEEIIDTYDKATSTAPAEKREDYVIGKHMVYGMFKYYPFNEMGFETVIPEEKFKVRINGLRNIRLMGKVDGRVKKCGLWWLREVKTTASKFMQAEARARVSYQAAGYIYGIQRAKGVKVQGVLFDLIKRSQLRKRVSETAEDFGGRIVADYRDNPTKLYRRYYSYRSPYQIGQYELDIMKAAQLIRTCRRTGNFMRNPDVCYFYGKQCPYMQICWVDTPDLQMLGAYYTKVVENPEM